jgi:hypothetical protein
MSKIRITSKLATHLTKIKSMDDTFLTLICIFYEETMAGTVLKHGDLFTSLWSTEANNSKIAAEFRIVADIEDLIRILKINFVAGGFGGGY